MSAFERFAPKVLVEIALSCLDKDFDYSSPYDDYEDNLKKLSDSSTWTGQRTYQEDVNFISSFIEENLENLEMVKNGDMTKNEILPTLIMPELKKYRIHYEIWGPATLTEKYTVNYETFSESLATNSLRQEYYDGNFDYYNGNFLEYETDNFEPDNFEITGVQKTENSSNLYSESVEKIVDKLDRDTLKKIKNLIERKLSS